MNSFKRVFMKKINLVKSRGLYLGFCYREIFISDYVTNYFNKIYVACLNAKLFE